MAAILAAAAALAAVADVRTARGSALLYSTYLGGTGGTTNGAGVAVDGSGNAYVTGSTTSANFPTLGALKPALTGTSDAYVTKLSPSGALVYSTYLGGVSADTTGGIAVGDTFASTPYLVRIVRRGPVNDPGPRANRTGLTRSGGRPPGR